MDIGHRMKELRIQYGLTQQELADRAELTKGFISQLERNQNSPSVGTLLDIIQCLGMTPAEFLRIRNLSRLYTRQTTISRKLTRKKQQGGMDHSKRTDPLHGACQAHSSSGWQF